MPVGICGGRVRLISDEAYCSIVHSLISRSRQLCLCSLFLVDLTPSRDPELVVDSLLLALRAAWWRGVDARFLIGGSRNNLDIAELSSVAELRARQLRIPCRWITRLHQRSSHMKLVVADTKVLTGSHNWTPGALSSQTQDSVLIESPDLAAYTANVFESIWARASENSADVQV